MKVHPRPVTTPKPRLKPGAVPKPQRPRLIESKTGFTTLVDVDMIVNQFTDSYLLRKCGMSINTLDNLRYRNKDVRLSTMLALLHELGYDLVAVPKKRRGRDVA